MADFNPNTTPTKGLEWLPHSEGVVSLDSGVKAAAMSIRQTTSQIIGTARVRLGARGASGGLYAVEVYDGEDAVLTGLATLTAQPNEDVSGTGTSTGQWREDDNVTTTAIYDQIDETTCDVADYIRLQTGTYSPGSNCTYRSRFNTGGLSLTGKRILALRLSLALSMPTGNTWDVGLNLSGVDYYAFENSTQIGSESCSAGGNPFSYTWILNPSTNMPWTIAEVQALDTTDEWFVTVRKANGNLVKVFWVQLEVVVATENRLATGTLSDLAGGLTPDAYNTVTLLTPTGGAWTDDASGYHLWLIRRLNSVGSFAIPYIDGVAAPNPARGWAPTLDATYGYVTAMGDALARVHAIIPRTSAPADSVDAQPYADLLNALVYNGQDAEQEFSDAGVSDYSAVRFVMKPNLATYPLLVKIKKRSDNSQVGGTLTIPVDLMGSDFTATPIGPSGWYLVEGGLSSVATLAGSTQYYIEFSSSAPGTGSDYWTIAALTSETFGTAAGFGGTTDRGLVNGSEADSYDIPFTIASAPITPADFAVALTAQTLDPSVCGASRLWYASMSWSATALAAEFVRYEVRRSLDGGGTWETVAHVLDEDVTAWADYEGTRFAQCCYQVRVVRDDNAASGWSAMRCVTPHMEGVELLLTSNQDPTLNLALDHDPSLQIVPHNEELVSTLAIFGRARRLAYRHSEDLGKTISYAITLGFRDRTPPGDGRGPAGFDQLLALARAALPYVCVLDRHGNRYLCSLTVREPSFTEPAHLYVVALDATEVSDTPYIVQVS